MYRNGAKINLEAQENGQFFYGPKVFTVNGYDNFWLGFVTFEMVAILCASATIVTTTFKLVAVTEVI